jgi:hypothetical protein
VADKIKLPVIGPVDQRWAVAGAALVAGIVGVAWWRRGMADSAEEVPADPGMDDGLAEGVDDGSPWPFRPAGGSTVDPADAGSAPTTNEAWTAEALDKMEAAGWNRQAVAVALGKYLSRKPLTAPTETELVQTAIALEGHPPQGSYSILPDTPTAPPRADPGAALPAPKLSVKPSGGNAVLSWTAVPGAIGYVVDRGGRAVWAGSFQHYTVSRKPPGSVYHVRALGLTRLASPPSNAVKVV